MYGQNIAYLRNNKGLTQRQLAAELNISSGALAMYETEKREPDIKIMQRIADYFNVDISFIITGKLSSDKDPLLERLRHLSEDNRLEVEKYISLLELKERHSVHTDEGDKSEA